METLYRNLQQNLQQIKMDLQQAWKGKKIQQHRGKGMFGFMLRRTNAETDKRRPELVYILQVYSFPFSM